MPHRSPRGTYLQIAQRLRNQITSGELPEGAPLPSEGQLAGQFGIARDTARKALAELEREGLITRVPAKGRYVGSAPAPVSAQLQPIVAELRVLAQSDEYADGAAFLSEHEVSERFGVTRHAARQALVVLEKAGLIVAVHGRGRFVSRTPR